MVAPFRGGPPRIFVWVRFRSFVRSLARERSMRAGATLKSASLSRPNISNVHLHFSRAFKCAIRWSCTYSHVDVESARQSMSSSFTFTRESATRLAITLVGALSGAVLVGLHDELVQRLESGEVECILFDLRDVRACDLSGREALVAVQRYLAEKDRRTAYLARRPRIRGVTLWVVHVAEDGKAKPVVSLDDAEDWFGLTESRLDEIERSTASSVIEAVKAAIRESSSRLRLGKGGR